MIKLLIVLISVIGAPADSLVTPSGKVPVYKEGKRLYILQGKKKQRVSKHNINLIKK